MVLRYEENRMLSHNQVETKREWINLGGKKLSHPQGLPKIDRGDFKLFPLLLFIQLCL